MNSISFSRTLFCIVIYYSLSIIVSYGQCPNNVTPQVISYDTMVTGGGNDSYEFTFRQFDPSLGTLISVNLETTITLKYGFGLENDDNIRSNIRVRVSRTDEITYPGGQLDTSTVKRLGPFALEGSDGVPELGFDYIEYGPIYETKYVNYNLTNTLASFLGNGTVPINYNTISEANSIANFNSTLRANAQDTIKFKITYNYCQTSFLAADINNFTVIKLASGLLQLSWFIPNDQVGKKYEIEKSLDARKFTIIKSIISTQNTGSNYQITYLPVQADKNKIFFRIRQFEANGSVKYSVIRALDIENKGAIPIKVYPAIATEFVKIFLPAAHKADWQINIISLSGQIVQQLNSYNTSFVKVIFNRPLQSGLYVVEAINKKTSERQSAKIIIQ